MSFSQLPPDSIGNARSVMLDLNIATRLATLHRKQLMGEPASIEPTQRRRLRWLAESLPITADVISGLAASEPEIRAGSATPNADRYGNRADVPRIYLGEWKSYLIHLLDGGESERRELPPKDVGPESSQFEQVRQWMQLGYATLLKAVQLHDDRTSSTLDRVERFRFWLEHEFQFLASREAWIGLILLGGRKDERDKVLAFLKILKASKQARSLRVWGAEWDVAYTRLAALGDKSFFPQIRRPVTLVTDDVYLAATLESISVLNLASGAHTKFMMEEMDGRVLEDAVFDKVGPWLARENQRLANRSRGVTNQALRRAERYARSLAREVDAA